MAYFKLQLMKLLKNSLTWLILGVVLLNSGFILTYNAVSESHTSIRTQVTLDLNQRNKEWSQVKSKLAQQKIDQSTKSNIGTLTALIESDRAVLKALDKNNWQEAYRLMIKQNKDTIARIKVDNEELKEEVKKKNSRLQALLRAGLQEENEQRPKSGFLFLFKLMEVFLPVILTVMFCFIFSSLFTTRYTTDRMDRAILLPSSHIVVYDLILGLTVTFVLMLLVGLLIFAVSSFFSGTGSLSYPLGGIILPQRRFKYMPLYAWFIPTLVLSALVGIFIVALILFLAQISRDKLTCLFTSLVVLLGGAVLPFILQKLLGSSQTSIIRLLPTTYILSAQVVAGNLGVTVNDTQVNFHFGCQVLTIAILTLTVLNLLWEKLVEQIKKLIEIN